MKFKPLEQIVAEKLSLGDLILVRECLSDGFKPYGEHTYPAFFGRVDTFSDERGKYFSPGTAVQGIRIFHRKDEDGGYSPSFEDMHHVFRDAKKGVFVPFSGDNNTRFYALIAKKRGLPKD